MSEAITTEEVVVDPVAVEAPVAEPIALHTETPTLLGEVKSPEPAAPAVDVAPVEPVKPVEPVAPIDADKPADLVVESPAHEPVALEPIAYPEWKLPEGVKADKDALGKFTEMLGGARIAPEVGQSLLDHHTSAMQQYAEHLGREQHRVFGETRAEWRKQVMADPEIGGAGHQTAMAAIARVRDAIVSTARPGTPQYESDMNEFNTALAITGMGDHPVLLKMLHRAARFIDEPGMGPSGIKPPPEMGGKPKSLRDVYKSNREARDGQ